MSDYNYETFSTDDYDFKNVRGPEVGDKAPDFRLTTVSGEMKNLLDFSTDFLVLETGSITCPLFQSRRKIMQTLEDAPSGISTAVLYVREAHPGEQIASHKSFDDKKACATRLRDHDGETRTIFVDDFDGAAHKAYGSMPNAVFIINKNGCVVYRSDWNNPGATRAAIDALVAGQKVTSKDYFRPATPKALLRTFRNAGKGSAADFLKGLPHLMWANLIRRNLRLLFNRVPEGSRNTLC